MSTKSKCTHPTNNKQQHHKSKSTQKIPPTLQLQSPTTNTIPNQPPLFPSSPTSTTSSSSYTLSTPTTPTSPAISPPISPPFRRSNTKTLTPKSILTHNTSTNNRNTRSNRTRLRSRSKPRSKKHSNKKKINTKTSTPPIHKTNTNLKLSTYRNKKYNKSQTLTVNRKKNKRKGKIKSKKKNSKTLKKTSKHNKYNSNCNYNVSRPIKHPKLKTSYSESRTKIKSKKNYHYYKPNDLFNDKPISRQPSHRNIKLTNIKSNNKKKYKKKVKRKKKKKRIKSIAMKQKMINRPSSTRMSNESDTDTDIQYIQYDENDDNNMHYIDYEIDNNNIDIDTGNGCSSSIKPLPYFHPSLQLSQSLSDGIGSHGQDIKHKKLKKNKKKKRIKNGRDNGRSRSKSPNCIKKTKTRMRSKSTNNNDNNNKRKKNKKKLKKKNGNKKKKKLNVNKMEGNIIQTHKPHSVSMENIQWGTILNKKVNKNVTHTPDGNGNGNGSNNNNNASPPVFFPRKISDSFNNINATSGKVHTFTPSLPASPRFWGVGSPNTPKTPGIFNITPDDFIHDMYMNKQEKSVSPNAARRNTIGFGTKKQFVFDDSKDLMKNKLTLKRGKKSNFDTLSLSALAHYFQYDTNHETKSILAQLARIIMECVGEPNVFSLSFKVGPEVGMAIRRNKLRISPVLHRGLVLSFCLYNMPKQLQSAQYNEYNDSLYEQKHDIYDNDLIDLQLNNNHSFNDICNNNSLLPQNECNDLPSDLGISSSSDEDRDDIKRSDRDSDDSNIRYSDDSNISNNTSKYIDYSSPSPPVKRKSKSKSGNTLSPNMDNDSDNEPNYIHSVSFGLTQSSTKTTNSDVSSSPDPILNEDEEITMGDNYLHKHGHGIRRSNSDIFNSHILDLCEKKDDIIDGNYVERLRNEKMSHVYQESDSFNFSIDMQDIRSNRSSNTLYEQDEMVRCVSIGQHDKSGSDMTVISVSNTTVSHRHNNKSYSSTYNYNDIPKYDNNGSFNSSYNNSSHNNYNSVTFTDVLSDDIPHTQIPTFIEGYETHTDSANILNNSNKKVNNNNKIVNDIPSAEYMKLNMKTRNSEKYLEDLGLMKQSLISPVNSDGCKETKNKLTDHVSIPDKDYDSSQEIEYNEYPDIEDNNSNDISKENEFRKNNMEQLKLRTSITSIPLKTIKVTTPNNTHTAEIMHMTVKKSKSRELTPITDIMNDDLKEWLPNIDDNDINTTFPYYRDNNINNVQLSTIQSMDNDSDTDTDTDSDSDTDENKYDNDEKEQYEFEFEEKENNNRHRRMPTLTRKNSQKKPTLSYISKSQSNSGTRSSNRSRSRSNRTMSATPKFGSSRKPALNLSGKTRKKGHRPRSQTCTNFENTHGFFNDYIFGDEPDLYSSIVMDNGSFLSRNIFYKNGLETNNLKFQKPFNKMVGDKNGNIFIGTDKYIRYITYNKGNKNSNHKYGKFRKQEKLLYELKYDEHLVSLWNQNGKIYFVTMPYALQDNHYKEYNKKSYNNSIEEWSLNLYFVDGHNYRQRSINKYEWIPPSVHDKLRYRKKTFRWKVRGRSIDNFLSMWYDEKYETLITLCECDRLNEPQLIFLNKKNDRGLIKLKIRNNTVSIYGNTNDTHDDASNNQHLLIRHYPTKSWLCCIPCIDKNDYKNKDWKKNNQKCNINQNYINTHINNDEQECWIQFKLNRECNKIISSKIIKLPIELYKKKWLSYDEYRDCLIGINRLGIEQLLESGFETKIQLFVVPRLTKLLQQNAKKQVYNEPKKKINKRNKNTFKHKRIRTRSSSSASNKGYYRKRSHSQKRRK